MKETEKVRMLMLQELTSECVLRTPSRNPECLTFGSSLLRSIGHRVKVHKITPVVGNESGDIEIKDYVIYYLDS